MIINLQVFGCYIVPLTKSDKSNLERYCRVSVMNTNDLKVYEEMAARAGVVFRIEKIKPSE